MENLLLLCGDHHEIVDNQPATYTVERLIGIKQDHEQWVKTRLREWQIAAEPISLPTEVVYSSVMPVEKMPADVYTAPCDLNETQVKALVRWGESKGAALPFIVRAGNLITFARLTDKHNPFRDIITQPGAAEKHSAVAWWNDKDLSSWYVTLLNRTLNKLTGRRGLNLDKEHNRYYFDPIRGEDGKLSPHPVEYRPLNMEKTTRNVAWQPTRKKTGQPKKHWIHLAVRLRFQRVSGAQWVLAMRPELRFTVDGMKPLVSKAIGRRATSKKSHLYNYDLLGELHFWREFLSEGKPHIIIDLFKQTLVIDARLLSGNVTWPGVPGDDKPFANVLTEHDLFTMSDYARALEDSPDPDAELEGWELDHLAELEELASEE